MQPLAQPSPAPRAPPATLAFALVGRATPEAAHELRLSLEATALLPSTPARDATARVAMALADGAREEDLGAALSAVASQARLALESMDANNVLDVAAHTLRLAFGPREAAVRGVVASPGCHAYKFFSRVAMREWPWLVVSRDGVGWTGWAVRTARTRASPRLVGGAARRPPPRPPRAARRF